MRKIWVASFVALGLVALAGASSAAPAHRASDEDGPMQLHGKKGRGAPCKSLSECGYGLRCKLSARGGRCAPLPK
jgi:hypothetical protein